MKGNRMDCNSYRGISLLSTSYKILSNILLWRITLYENEIIGEYECGAGGINHASIIYLAFGKYL